MSLKNIVRREVQPNGKEHIVFKTDTHEVTYAFTPKQQKSLAKGTDPSDLSGKFVSKEKLKPVKK